MSLTAEQEIQSFADAANQMENASFDYGAPGDEKLVVRFEQYPHKNDAQTREEGRPIFEMTEYIKIMVPGDKDTVIHRPVREADKVRFSKQYERFRANLSQSTGFPLSEWPKVTRAQVEELAYFNIRSVEDLANVNDGVIGRFAGLVDLRRKAQEHLALLKEQAPMDKLQAELAKRDEQIAALTAQMNELVSERVNAKTAKVPVAEA